MRAGINAAADDCQAAIGQIPGHTFGRLIPLRGRTSRANDGNRVAIQKFNISAHVEQRRRTVNLAQALSVQASDAIPARRGTFRNADAAREARCTPVRTFDVDFRAGFQEQSGDAP